jgi:hypothetical protein
VVSAADPLRPLISVFVRDMKHKSHYNLLHDCERFLVKGILNYNRIIDN